MMDAFFTSLPELLLTQIWQVTLLGIIVATIHRIFAGDRPHLAHALWVLVLIKCITPPIIGSPMSPYSWLASSHKADVIESNAMDANSLESSRDIVAEETPSTMVFPHLKPQVVDAMPLSNPTVPRLSNRKVKSANSDNQPANGLAPAGGSSWFGELTLRRLCLQLWAFGVGISLTLAVVRWLVFYRWIKRHQTSHEAGLDRLVVQLSKRIGLRRKVRLMVGKCAVGPAVVGILRPTILVPFAMIDSKTDSELEPLFAHELIHIRRGDLWWSLLQTMARAVFWFHPLVWWASAMVTRESERSCDEETIATLQCSPRNYANSLIDVLELKYKLKRNLWVAPTVPGVRPIDITVARLERVMKLGNGCQSRTPVWIWAALIMGCLIVLPGAAFAIQEANNPLEEKAQRLPLLTDQQKLDWVDRQGKAFVEKLKSKSSAAVKQDLRLPTAGNAVTNSLQEKTDAVWHQREIGDLLAKIAKRDLKGQSAKDWLLAAVDGGRKVRGMNIQGAKLVFMGGPEVTNGIDDILQHWRKHGFDMAVLRTQFLSIPRAEFERLDIDWSLAENTIGEPAAVGLVTHSVGVPFLNGGDRLFKNVGMPPTKGTSVASASYTSNKRVVVHGLIEETEKTKILEQFKGLKSSRISSKPSMTIQSGTEGSIKTSIGSRPFVVALQRIDEKLPLEKGNVQPIVRTVTEGLTLKQMISVDVENEKTQLGFDLEISQVTDVDVIKMPFIGEGVQIQQPKVDRLRVASQLEIPFETNTAVICYFDKKQVGDKTVEVAELILVTVNALRFEDVGSLPVEAPVYSKGKGPYQEASPGPDQQASPVPFLSNLPYAGVPPVEAFDFEIIGAVPGKKTGAIKRAEAFLANLDFATQLQGKLECQFSDDGSTLTISGDQISLGIPSDKDSFYMSAKQVKFRVEAASDGMQNMKFELSGDVEVKSMLPANDVVLEGRSQTAIIEHNYSVGEVKLQFIDNVVVQMDGAEIRADEVKVDATMDSTSFSITGKATLAMEAGEQVSTVEGEQILWDCKKGSFSVKAGKSPKNRQK